MGRLLPLLVAVALLSACGGVTHRAASSRHASHTVADVQRVFARHGLQLGPSAAFGVPHLRADLVAVTIVRPEAPLSPLTRQPVLIDVEVFDTVADARHGPVVFTGGTVGSMGGVGPPHFATVRNIAVEWYGAARVPALAAALRDLR